MEILNLIYFIQVLITGEGEYFNLIIQKIIGFLLLSINFLINLNYLRAKIKLMIDEFIPDSDNFERAIEILECDPYYAGKDDKENLIRCLCHLDNFRTLMLNSQF